MVQVFGERVDIAIGQCTVSSRSTSSVGKVWEKEAHGEAYKQEGQVRNKRHAGMRFGGMVPKTTLTKYTRRLTRVGARVWNAIPLRGFCTARWTSMANGRRTVVTEPKRRTAQATLKTPRRARKGQTFYQM